MNWLETTYPSPAFPNPHRAIPGVGSTHYFAAYTWTHRQYPPLRQRLDPGIDPQDPAPDPSDPNPQETANQVANLMQRIEIIGNRQHPHLRPPHHHPRPKRRRIHRPANRQRTRMGLPHPNRPPNPPIPPNQLAHPKTKRPNPSRSHPRNRPQPNPPNQPLHPRLTPNPPPKSPPPKPIPPRPLSKIPPSP